ncbi:MAG: hypothetical protein ACRDBQ_18110 [Shewanella sp.]
MRNILSPVSGEITNWWLKQAKIGSFSEEISSWDLVVWKELIFSGARYPGSRWSKETVAPEIWALCAARQSAVRFLLDTYEEEYLDFISALVTELADVTASLHCKPSDIKTTVLGHIQLCYFVE